MRAKKLTRSAREQIRKLRQETQLIMARANERNFEYVVNPPIIPKIVFGSGLERETLPMSGPNLTSFMRSVQGEIRDFPGPSDYTVSKDLLHNYPSKAGYSPFASKTVRIPDLKDSPYPPIGAYEIGVRKPAKPDARPFGVGAKRDKVDKFLTPGPPTYPHHLPMPTMNISMAFGSKRVIWPAVAVFCAPFNISKCFKCGLTPFGDYWHNFSSNQDMCRSCMNKDLCYLKNCSTDLFERMRRNRELSRFRPARYCAFFHDHAGTLAATQLISNKTLRFKIKKENYLSIYSPGKLRRCKD